MIDLTSKTYNFLEKIKRNMCYNKCYDLHENQGIAIFECCSGEDSKMCKSCPYFVDVWMHRPEEYKESDK